MTDNEIIKALEKMRENLDDGYTTCLDYGGKRDMQAESDIHLYGLVIDLINRQQAEIERLKVLDGWHDSAVRRCKEVEEKLRTAKSEAYKEFADEVNKELFGEEYQLDKVHRRAVERVLNRLTSKE